MNLRIHSIRRDESELDPNKTLRSMVNKGLTQRNELVANKSDLEFSISAITGEGFDALLSQLERQAAGFLAGSESALVTRRAPPPCARGSLGGACGGRKAPDVAAKEDLLAEELRLAATRARPPHRPGRCRGYPGRDFPRLLHRQIRDRPPYFLSSGEDGEADEAGTEHPARENREEVDVQRYAYRVAANVSRETFCKTGSF